MSADQVVYRVTFPVRHSSATVVMGFCPLRIAQAGIKVSSGRLTGWVNDSVFCMDSIL